MSKEHCFDYNGPLNQLDTIKTAYDKAIEARHALTDEADWRSMAEGVGVNYDAEISKVKINARPDSVIGSDWYNTFLTNELTELQRYKVWDGRAAGNSALIAESEAVLGPRDVLDFVNSDLPTIIAFYDSAGVSPTGGTPGRDLVSALDAIPEVCPDDFDEFIKIAYTSAMIAFYVDKFVEFKKNQALASGTSTTVGGTTTFTGALTPAEIAQIEKEATERALATLEEIAEDIFAEVKLYQEQCFVLSQLTSLIEYKKTSEDLLPRLPYYKFEEVKETGRGSLKQSEISVVEKNAPILMQGEPFGFMNRLVQYPSAKKLFNLTTAQISSLVPTIRLYRVETSPTTGRDIGVTEIKFDPNPAVKSYENGKSALDLFTDKKKRGYGVGLQSFDFTFHGSDPFAVKKAIQAKLSIFATSFGDLITERNGYKFADLALRTGKTPEDLRKNLDIIDQQNLDKLNFRLKAVVGWAVPKELVGSFQFSEIDAVNNSFVTLNLSPTTHEFNFDEMGGVVFTINYLAYIEDYFNQTKFNIFSDPQLEATRNARSLFYQFINTQGCDQESLDIIKDADAQVIQNEKRRSFSSILKNLRRRNKLLTYNISYDDVSKFLRTGRVSDSSSLVPKTFDNSSGNAIQAAYRTYTDGVTGDANERDRVAKLTQEDNAITFFFVSDLLSVIMESIDDSFKQTTEVEKSLDFLKMIQAQGIYDAEVRQRVSTSLGNAILGNAIKSQEYSNFIYNRGGKEYKQSLLKAKAQFEKLRIVLGPVEIRNPFKTSEIQFCSIGDIPLSLNYFTEFLTKKMIGRDETYYPLTNFVKDLVNDVIKNFLNNDGCFDFGIRQKLKLNSTVIAAYNSPENRYHSTSNNSGYEIPKEEFETGKAPLDDITYYIGNNRITKGEPGFGAGNVFDLTKTGIQPILQVSGPDRSPVVKPPIGREMNYYVFYAGRAYPTNLMAGNEEIDSQNGIFHYVLGKDRGIVKNISLDRTDMNGLKELRFEKEGFDGLTQLREVYNTSIDCFLNVSALPGSYIYVDPRGFSPEAGINYSQFGIGGYYMITRAEHSIAPGKADTKIVAKWVADTNGRIESAENNNSKTVDRNPNNKTAQKCLAKVRKPTPRKSSEEDKYKAGTEPKS